MNAVNDFGDVFLVIEIGQFEDERLHVSVTTRIRTHLRKTDVSNEVEEIIDIVRLPETMFRFL